ncbi:PsiF family protein [Microvirga flavescens]|uniref:PsiF family protein n=1 Tax=Microvirga flavescens TaxID=2249811 RepID=UPI000DDAF569|nr:PsiF family protein [Microvirga flavescens]
MKAIVPVALAFLAFSAATASAQQLTPQQERMKTCNTEASSKHMAGGARKTFMSDCLAGKTGSTTTLTPQQEKMKTCNTEASAKKMMGDARQKFMSSCLKD